MLARVEFSKDSSHARVFVAYMNGNEEYENVPDVQTYDAYGEPLVSWKPASVKKDASGGG